VGFGRARVNTFCEATPLDMESLGGIRDRLAPGSLIQLKAGDPDATTATAQSNCHCDTGRYQ
jgi:hypothetical protein